jgi:hypothetical protein
MRRSPASSVITEVKLSVRCGFSIARTYGGFSPVFRSTSAARQGELFLLRALAEATGAFCFAVTEATAAESLREFGAALAAHAGGRG